MQYAIQVAVDAAALGGLYALFALGVSLIFGIMRLINFAHGELIMVGGYALVFLSWLPLPLTLLATAVCCVVAALVMERVAFRPVRDADPATLLVTSFAVSYLLQNLAILTIGSLPRSVLVSTALAQPLSFLGITISRLSLVSIVVSILFVAGIGLFLNRTPVGIQMRAAAEDFSMVRLLGVRANGIIATAFGLSGLLAAAAAFLLVSQTGNVTATIGSVPVLIAFIAAVIGGMRSLAGAAIAGFGLGAFSVFLQAILPLSARPFRDAIVFAVVFLVMMIRPNGLIVARGAVARV